jgi:hypothetical protein
MLHCIRLLPPGPRGAARILLADTLRQRTRSRLSARPRRMSHPRTARTLLSDTFRQRPPSPRRPPRMRSRLLARPRRMSRRRGVLRLLPSGTFRQRPPSPRRPPRMRSRLLASPLRLRLPVIPRPSLPHRNVADRTLDQRPPQP